ncbi:hypothetical protein Tdes44962_MAKER07939 [Teratosphaeria destructans]|uniref:Uncharacterized protein n=1 Tax=Teratosphaeria destructans TaxID=418781 RepID=A0A9W7W591_9PEZI|nr:hypothetical protein Tdes44962_MAKER07939 [Teratosphaeria destructans]
MPLRPSSLRRTPSRPSRNGSHPYVRFDFDDFGNTAPTLSNAVSDNNYPKTQDSGGAAGATPTTTSPTDPTTAYRPLRILRIFLVIFLLPLTLILFSPFILGFILSSSPFLTPAQAPPQTPAPTPLSSTALPIDHLIHAILQLSHGFDSGVSAFDDAAFAPCIAVWMGAELLSGTRQGADDGRSEVMRKFENIAVNGAEGIWPVAEVFLEIQGLVGGLEVVLVTLGATASQEAEHIRRLLVPEEATALAMTSPSYLALITRFWYTRVWHSTLALHEADDESSSQFPLWVRGVRTAITSPVWNLWLHYVFYGSWEPFPVSLRHHHTIMASALLNATSEVTGSLRQIQDLGVPCVDQLVAFQTKLASASHQTHLGPRFLDDVMRRDLEPVCKWARSQSAPVEGEAPYANLLHAVDTLQQLERRLQDIVDLSRRRGRTTTGWRALSGPSDVQELEHRGRKMLGRQLWEIGGWIERWGIEDGRGGA